jgi:hypothetical protein
MKELPFFKFYPNQWITGTISFLEKDVQGAYMIALCYYWSKNCEMPLNQLKMIIPNHYQQLLHVNLFKIVDGKIRIKFLDEQYSQFKTRSKINAENGSKGGKAKAKKFSDPALNNEEGIRKYLKEYNDSKAIK